MPTSGNINYKILQDHDISPVTYWCMPYLDLGKLFSLWPQKKFDLAIIFNKQTLLRHAVSSGTIRCLFWDQFITAFCKDLQAKPLGNTRNCHKTHLGAHKIWASVSAPCAPAQKDCRFAVADAYATTTAERRLWCIGRVMQTHGELSLGRQKCASMTLPIYAVDDGLPFPAMFRVCGWAFHVTQASLRFTLVHLLLNHLWHQLSCAIPGLWQNIYSQNPTAPLVNTLKFISPFQNYFYF